MMMLNKWWNFRAVENADILKSACQTKVQVSRFHNISQSIKQDIQ